MTTRTEAASEVRKVLQSVKDRLAMPGGAKVNEATTRAHFISPLLVALGYQSIDDVLFEYYLPDGKQFLDYRLVVDGKPRVAVEAKALDVPLTDQHAAQAVSYASVLGDEWAVVTNARHWRLYHAFAQAPLADKLILTADLVGWQSDAQFDSMFEQLWLVSKESFVTADGPASWLASQRLDHLLRDALTDPASPEIKYIRKQLDAQGVAVTAEQVASWLRARLDTQAAVVPKPAPQVVGPPATFARAITARSSAEPPAPKPTRAPGAVNYWLIPAGRKHGMSAAQHLELWLNKGFWGFWEKTPARKAVHAGDWAAFYASKQSEVLAYARVGADPDTPVSPEEWPEPGPPDQAVTYKLPLADVTWLPQPVRLDSPLRAQLDAFAGKNPDGNWSWIVQSTQRVTEADFSRLTGRKDVAER